MRWRAEPSVEDGELPRELRGGRAVSLSTAPSSGAGSSSKSRVEELCCNFEEEYDEDELEENEDFVIKRTCEWFMERLGRRQLEFRGNSWKDDNAERLCAVCKSQYFNGFVALIRHAETFGKKMVPTHRGYALALTRMLDSLSKPVETPKRDITVFKRPLDNQIIWPPLVIVENTRTNFVNGKWEGLGNEEIKQKFLSQGCDLLEKAKNVYDPKGHAGISFLQFEASELGYIAADTLHSEFQNNRLGRTDWLKKRYSSHEIKADGKFLLFGYIATPDDMKKLDPKKKYFKWSIESKEEKVDKALKKMKENKKADEITIIKQRYENQKLSMQLEKQKLEMDEMHEKMNAKIQSLEDEARRARKEMIKKDEEFQKQIYKMQKANESERKKYSMELMTKSEAFEKEQARFRLELSEKEKIFNDQHQEKFKQMVEKSKKVQEDLANEYRAKVAEALRKDDEEKKQLEMEKEKQRAQYERELTEYAIKLKNMEEALTQFKEMKNQQEDVGKECGVCFFPFKEPNESAEGNEDHNYRALLVDCRHAKVCYPCMMAIYRLPKKEKRLCPICKAQIKKEPVELKMWT